MSNSTNCNVISLPVLVRSYRTHHDALHNMLEAFQNLPSLVDAIYFGAAGLAPINDRDPKSMYRHQHRLGREFCDQVAKHLVTKEGVIEKCQTFEDLKKCLERETQEFNGFGELALYDTAVRIGAKKNIFPAFVYLHAGTKIGADNLGLEHCEGKIAPNILPHEFRDLQSPPLGDDRICVYAEDFLCIYKNELSDLRQGR